MQHLKKGLSIQSLKIIAMVAMCIDHIGLLISMDYYHPVAAWFHLVGRTTGPLMFFFVAEGYHHTHNINRYTMRMALFALISYFPFVLFVNNGLPTTPYGWLRLNAIYTMLVGLLALRARHEVKNPVISTCLVALCLVASVYGDWSYKAVIAILMFDLLRGSLTNQRIGFCLVALLFNVMLPLSDIMTGVDPELVGRNFARFGVRLFMLFPMLMLGWYNGEHGKGNKWLFYIVYPVHLLILFFVAQWLGVLVEM